MTIRISEELNLILNFSREEAMRTGSYGIGPDHMMLGIIRHGDNQACEILKELGLDLQEMKQFIDSKIFSDTHIPFSEIDRINFSRSAHNILSFSVLEATRLRCDEASAVHLLLALSRSTGNWSQSYLLENGVEYGRLLDRCSLLDLRGTAGESAKEEEREEVAESPVTEEEENGQSATPLLDEFAYDLSLAAVQGRLDPVVGRDAEMDRVARILGRRRKNSPMLVGESGVGKSAIVEGIALRIASGDVPSSLRGKRILSLDIASIVAGTRYRGDFEKRLKGIIKELTANPDIILFIDEFHTLVGAGSASGSLDAANMLKPALARGEIQCIGATTIEEFTRIVEKDGALERRFQKLMIEPAGVSYTISILESIKDRYEAHHEVRYSPEAIEACALLSDRYVTDRCLPDKAIDALDEAGSMVRIKRDGKGGGNVVKASDVAKVISLMTGIPAGRIAEGESRKLMEMEEVLRSRIIGQDEAVRAVVKAIRRSRSGIGSPDRPIGSFLFFGPTGVGKTQLAKAIAEYLFDSEDNLIRIDMNEYGEKFNATRLIGAPPGYVGFEDGGQLSEQVRRKPYSVVLLDEIEKAHPDIFNLLLQLLDEGRLSDSNGRVVNFRNTIIVMTSNVGSRELDEYGNGMGFATAGRDNNARREAILEKSVKKLFPPEFLNRVDEMVYFKQLDEEALSRIIDLEIRDLHNRLAASGFRLTISPAAKKFVAGAGYDPNYGARPLKRAIRKYIEDPVADFIIADRLDRGGRKAPELRTIKVSLAKNKTGEEPGLAISLK